MMLQVVGYSIGVGAALAVAGWCQERAAGLLRLPRRGGWIAVMMLSVLVPGVMIIAADPVTTRPLPALPVVAAPAVPPSLVEAVQPGAEPAPMPLPMTIEAPPAGVRQSTWNISLPTDAQLALVWLFMSLAVVLHLCIAYALLRRRAARWQPGRIHEEDVLVSEVTGPALLGVLRPRMVVPRWLQSQSPAAQALVLEHEREHVQARDPLLILAGWLIVAAVPWSPPLWWQWRRLRQAIELDCDARVMKRGAEAATYAEVLLAVTQRAGSIPAGALAMSEPVHALERRIAALMPDAVRHARLQVAGALLLAVAGAGVALALEAPALPGSASPGAQVEVPQPAAPEPDSTPEAPVVVAAAAPDTQATGAAAPRVPVRAAAAPVSPPGEPAPATPEATSTEAGSEVAPFMVRVRTPVFEPRRSPYSVTPASPVPTGPPGEAHGIRLDRYYTALLEKLRAVPGLILVTDATPVVSGVQYEITLMLGEESRGVSIEARTLFEGRESRVGFRNFDALPRLLPRLEAFSDDVPVENPERDMEGFVEQLRLALFPRDEGLLAGMLAQFLDARLDTARRMRVLNQLMTADRRQDRFRGNLPPTTYSPDPILFAAATEVATSASDPVLRQRIWSMLGGIGIPRVDPAVLIRPVERALAKETDLRVQLVLVTILSLNPGDSRSRSVLEPIARGAAGSSHPQIIRMAARRVLDGDASWNEYLVSRLDDPRVTDAEKLELLQYSYTMGSAMLGPEAARLKLDESAERSVASLMRRQGATELANLAAQLLGWIGGDVAREEMIGFLRAGTGGQAAADNEVRRTVLTQLAYSLPSRPEIRPLFEDVAERDVDPVMREAARQALAFRRAFSIGNSF